MRLSLSFVAHAQCDVERLSHILFCTTVAFCDMKNNAFTPCIEKDVFVFCSGINPFGTASWFIFCDMKNNAFTPCIEKDVFVFCSGINPFGTASWFILVCLFYVIPGVVGRPINF